MKPAIRLVFKAAACRANVLLVGESGVGKAFISRRIHDASYAASGLFQTLFCLPSPTGKDYGQELIDRLRDLERRCGTVYVRGVDLLSPLNQMRLLTYLDERERRMNRGVGSSGMFARLIFASQKNLRLEAARGRFCRELYLRVSVITIEVPPLRQRGADIVSLAKHFLDLYSDSERKEIGGLTADAKVLLRHLAWEGNIHELKNAINRAVVLAEEGEAVSAGTLRVVLQEAGG
jgi:DNA-binding NtrC family response regulator